MNEEILKKWSDEALSISIEWANRAEHLRKENHVGPCLIADSLSVMARCLHNALAAGRRG